jgi:hypothetical protein
MPPRIDGWRAGLSALGIDKIDRIILAVAVEVQAAGDADGIRRDEPARAQRAPPGS